MCGIVAIHGYASTVPGVDEAELCAIRDHMTRRGPDGSGKWLSADGRTGLGHRRLAIIDLNERAAQPMASADGQLVITFNGEIYNHRALRSQLEARGYGFRTESDTEVLLQLYAERGPRMVEALRGMFAFAIWDGRARTMLLARDPYGIKPLYYADDGQTVRVASQVKALMAGAAISDEVDPAGAVGFLLLGSVPEPFTLYRKISLLPAGSYLTVTERGLGRPQQYFSVAQQLASACENSANQPRQSQEEVIAALRESVRDHLVADVPVGAFLSAGIDSGSLLALMAELRPAAEHRTLTLGFELFRGTESDETLLAAEIARHHRTQHTTRFTSVKEFLRDRSRILAAMDQPSVDGINSWLVSKAAAEAGLKVCISGLGGDELFGGYPSFQSIPAYVRAARYPARIPGAGRLVRQLTQSLVARTGISPKAAGLLEYAGSFEGAYLLKRGLFMPWELPSLAAPAFVREGLERLDILAHLRQLRPTTAGSAFAEVAALESSVYMRNQLLRDVDWASMDHSLEVRVPLVDSALLSAIARYLVSPNRPLNKEALSKAPVRSLPPHIVTRRKTGFSIPMDAWVAAMEREDGTSSPSRKVHWSRRWALQLIGDHLPRD